jgi:[phosphatase 2A protein]-leucine-carboxy methyltransferase
MSNPQIPHLSTLRRGGGHTAGGVEGSHERDEAAKEKIIQSTDFDAATSRLSAVQAGYLDDPFARLLIDTSDRDPVGRKLPLMNRG